MNVSARAARRVTGVLALAGTVSASLAAPAQAQTTRASVRQDGAQITGGVWSSTTVSIAAGGTVVAFDSPIDSIVADDTNLARDVFVWDFGLIGPGGQMRRAVPEGVQPNADSFHPSVSADGTRVVFSSRATNLIPGDTTDGERVFLFDRPAQTLTHVSTTPDVGRLYPASLLPSISPNGRYVAFLSRPAGSFTSLYLRDLQGGHTYEVLPHFISLPHGWSEGPTVADDGTVAFLDTLSGSYRVRVVRPIPGQERDEVASTTATGGAWPSGATAVRPSISADGRTVSYQVAAPHGLAGTASAQPAVVVKHLDSGAVTLVDAQAAGAGSAAAHSASLSPDGRDISFFSRSSTLAAGASRWGLYRADLSTGAAVVTPLQPGTLEQWASTPVAVDDNGAIVALSDVSRVENAQMFGPADTAGDTDVFVLTSAIDFVPATVRRLSIATTYSGANTRPAVNWDGSIVAFLSTATRTSGLDRNVVQDLVIRDRTRGTTERVSVSPSPGVGAVEALSLSADGRLVALASSGGAWLYDRRIQHLRPGAVVPATGASVGNVSEVALSADGGWLAYVTTDAVLSGETAGVRRVYVTSTSSAHTVRVDDRSLSDGQGLHAFGVSLSGNGRRVGYLMSNAALADGSNRRQLLVFDRDVDGNGVFDEAGQAATLWVSRHVPPWGEDVTSASLSVDGLVASYRRGTSTWVALVDGVPAPVEVGAPDALLTLEERYGRARIERSPFLDAPTLSAYGGYVAYRTRGAVLLSDTNEATDVYLQPLTVDQHGITPGEAIRQSVGVGDVQGTGGVFNATGNPVISGNGRVVCFESGFDNLVVGDTNGMVDVFCHDDPSRPLEPEPTPGYTAWITSFGADPAALEAAPWVDANGSGLTSLEQFLQNPSVNPLLGAFTRYFAEGATQTPALRFEHRLALVNPSAVPVDVQLSYQLPDGHANPTDLQLGPFERRTLILNDVPGLEAAQFATTVRASAPIGTDRTMSWDETVYAAHAETGIESPSMQWYFAEGATIAGFQTFYLLQNPDAHQSVTVRGNYLRADGATFTKLQIVPPSGRLTIWANVEVFDDGAMSLAGQEFSAEFLVESGPAIVAERAMYLSGTALFDVGHEAAGSRAPAVDWFFAEGNVGNFFSQFILVANPAHEPAQLEVDYMRGPNLTLPTVTHVVPARSRLTIWVNEESVPRGFAGRVYLFRNSPSADISVRVRSVNEVPVVAERAMWWPGQAGGWYEAHTSSGTTRTASRWVVAEGETGGALGWDTFVLVANTADTAGAVRLTLLGEDGQPPLTYGPSAVQAESRTSFRLSDMLAVHGFTAGRFGVLVESVGEALPLVVERAMYRSEGGQQFRVGTSALGTPLP